MKRMIKKSIKKIQSNNIGLSDTERSISTDLAELSDELVNYVNIAKSPTFKCLSYLLSSQNPDGSWAGVEEYSVWQPLVTAYVADFLFDIGFRLNFVWTKSDGTKGSLNKTIQWLINHKKNDNSFGEDFWDTCFITRVLYRYGKEENKEIIQLAIDFIEKELGIEENDLFSQGDWGGPAFYAQAILLFSEIGDVQRCEDLKGRLLKLQKEDGEFSGNNPYYSIFHTAQALVALKRLGFTEKNNEVAKSLKWLKMNQNSDGSWGKGDIRMSGIITAHAILAIGIIEGCYSNNFKNGKSWLISHQNEAGLIIDITASVTAMKALVLDNKELENIFIPSQNILSLSQAISDINLRVTELEKKYRAARDSLTKFNDVIKFSRISGILITSFSFLLFLSYLYYFEGPLKVFLSSLINLNALISLIILLIIPLFFFYPFTLGFFISFSTYKRWIKIIKAYTVFIVLGYLLVIIADILVR